MFNSEEKLSVALFLISITFTALAGFGWYNKVVASSACEKKRWGLYRDD